MPRHSRRMDTDSLERARAAVVMATLAHVPFDGWSAKALAAGAVSASMAADDAARLFPAGPIEALEVFSALADRAMVEAIAATADMQLGQRAKIALGIRARLDFVTVHKEAVRRAAAVLAMPHHAAAGLRLLYRTVDALWYAAGDSATDFNWYTKRAILAGIYSATLLFWLNDRSADHAATWAFLDRRLADHARMHGLVERLKERAGRMPNPFLAADRFRGDRVRRRRMRL